MRVLKGNTRQVGEANAPSALEGIYRLRKGRGFVYVDHRGRVVPAKVREWAERLRIPPAWTDVWISPDPAASLLATGRDAKNRKQYRYSSDWRASRDDEKYRRVIDFGRSVGVLRKQAARDVRRPGLSQRKVLAAIILLLDRTNIRVGNEEYKRTNNSYGLATMQDEHVVVRGSSVTFEFVGKSGKDHSITIVDRTLAPIVKQCRALPGPDLFQYVDDTGVQRDVTAAHVNDYLREVTGQNFSAKDFRTWSGTVLAAVALAKREHSAAKTRLQKNVRAAIEEVSQVLGNTVAICRSCYVHPHVVRAYLEGTLVEELLRPVPLELKRRLPGVTSTELSVLRFLERQLAQRGKGRRDREVQRTAA